MRSTEHTYARNEAGVVKRMLRSSLSQKRGWIECDPPEPKPPTPRRKPQPRAPKSPSRPAQRTAPRKRAEKEQ